MSMIALTILFLLLAGCILTHSQLSLAYAGMGLELWFRNMIPSLLPFMILSGIMIRMKLTEKASMILYPIAGPIYKVRKNVCYAMLIGFLCGFPMGAKTVADLYSRQMITKREAEYLLAFCNNIGPVYFCSFVLPLLGRKLVFPYLFGMYGIPLLYGFCLRRTVYRDLPLPQGKTPSQEKKSPQEKMLLQGITPLQGKTLPQEKMLLQGITPPQGKAQSQRKRQTSAGLVCCEADSGTKPGIQNRSPGILRRLLAESDHAIQSSIQAILSLGGYMILYNLLNLIPHILLGHPLRLLSPLLEITGGLKILGASLPLYSFLALSFGGFSCIAQTYNCIGETDLSIGGYVLHKLVLTALNGIFYLCWFQMSPASFLR